MAMMAMRVMQCINLYLWYRWERGRRIGSCYVIVLAYVHGRLTNMITFLIQTSAESTNLFHNKRVEHFAPACVHDCTKCFSTHSFIIGVLSLRNRHFRHRRQICLRMPLPVILMIPGELSQRHPLRRIGAPKHTAYSWKATSPSLICKYRL